MAADGTLVMKQPIAGVAPAEISEVTVMTVWPSNSVYLPGRLLGRLYAIGWPNLYIFKLGNLMALASIPVALMLFFMRLAPWFGIRYRLTNRRLIVQRGLQGMAEKWVDLDRFDEVEIDVRPGQAWYVSGDLIFKLRGVETFRLGGVSRPEAFRTLCVNAARSNAGVRKALLRESAGA